MSPRPLRKRAPTGPLSIQSTSWYQRWYRELLRSGFSPPFGSPSGSLPMRLLVGVPVLVDGRLNVGVSQLLLDEVDRLTGSQPERRGGVAEVVKANRGGEASVLERDVMPASADVVSIQHQTWDPGRPVS